MEGQPIITLLPIHCYTGTIYKVLSEKKLIILPHFFDQELWDNAKYGLDETEMYARYLKALKEKYPNCDTNQLIVTKRKNGYYYEKGKTMRTIAYYVSKGPAKPQECPY